MTGMEDGTSWTHRVWAAAGKGETLSVAAAAVNAGLQGCLLARTVVTVELMPGV